MSQINSKSRLFPKWVVFQFTNSDNPNKHKQLDFQKVDEIIDITIKHNPHYELFIDNSSDIALVAKAVKKINSYDCRTEVVCSGLFDFEKLQLLLNAHPYQLWFEISFLTTHPCNVPCQIQLYLDLLFHCRQLMKGSDIYDTKIGLSLWVNGLTYNYIFDIISSLKDIIDIYSIEFQRFLSNKKWLEYCSLVNQEFNSHVKMTRELVVDLKGNNNIDFTKLEDEICKSKAFCLNHNIAFFIRPKTINSNNYKSYFNGEWENMSDKKRSCIYPYILLEINKYGQVSLCHNFFDYAVGNIWKNDVLDIFFNDCAINIRNYTKKKIMPNCVACSRYYD